MTLVLESLDFAYVPQRLVLRSVSASLEPGRLTAVVGPNGAGKSTLLRLLIGAIEPSRGRVLLGDREVSALPAAERARRVAYVSQRPALAAAFTVRESVALGRFAASGGPEAARGAAVRRAVERALADLDLADRAGDIFQTLSVGQQQRAALARALCQLGHEGEAGAARADGGPQALIVDEPTAALDPRHALHAMTLLREQAGRGRIVVAAIHDLTAARRFADDALVLTEQGSVAAAGPAEATLTPAVLEPVFGVRFLESRLEEGSVAFVPAAPVGSR